jgi:hypothetical protein
MIDKIRSNKTRDLLLSRAENRAKTELEKDIETAIKFNTLILEDTDDTDTINLDVKKSSIFNLDEILTKFNYRTFKRLYDNFDHLDGISQLAFSLIFQSSLIL